MRKKKRKKKKDRERKRVNVCSAMSEVKAKRKTFILDLYLIRK